MFHHRKGVLIRYSDNFVEAVTEVSPLPGFSSETFYEVISVIKDQHESLNSFFSKSYSPNELKVFLKQLPNLPSLQFALSFLGLQILSNRNRQSLFELFDVSRSRKIRINDVLPIQDVDETIRHLKESYQKGFRTFKIKSGYPADNLIEILEGINKTSIRDCKFRIDANQSWPAYKSSEIIQSLEKFNIEYIEEPFQNYDLQALTNFEQTSSIPIALDESIQSTDHLKKLLQILPDTIFVIKPLILGNLFDLFETLAQYRTHFNRIVVTTALESSIGRKAVASVASLIGDQAMAHGLNTGRFFKTDLSNDYPISNGSIEIPETGFYATKIADLNNSHYQSVD